MLRRFNKYVKNIFRNGSSSNVNDFLGENLMDPVVHWGGFPVQIKMLKSPEIGSNLVVRTFDFGNPEILMVPLNQFRSTKTLVGDGM